MDATQRRQLAGQIRQQRKARGMTQRELAVAAGLSLRAVQNAETGENVPQEGNLLAMLDALGVEGDPDRTRESWSADIQVFLDIMGAWLSAMPEQERRSQMRDLTMRIVGRR